MKSLQAKNHFQNITMRLYHRQMKSDFIIILFNRRRQPGLNPYLRPPHQVNQAYQTTSAMEATS